MRQFFNLILLCCGARVRVIIADPEGRSRMEKEGSELVGSTPKEFGAPIGNEVQMWGKLLKCDTLLPFVRGM